MAKVWNEVKEALKDIYPGMSKSVYSMGKNPQYYGVELTERAKMISREIEPRLEHRKNPCRLYLRVDKDLYKAVLSRLDGRSIQEYLMSLVKEDVKQTKSA